MTKTTFPKVKIAIVIFLFVSFSAYSQNCEVDNASLKGTYTGDCKKIKPMEKAKQLALILMKVISKMACLTEMAHIPGQIVMSLQENIQKA
jgi:hypothetical protein